jgi:hypothetical protein
MNYIVSLKLEILILRHLCMYCVTCCKLETQDTSCCYFFIRFVLTIAGPIYMNFIAYNVYQIIYV